MRMAVHGATQFSLIKCCLIISEDNVLLTWPALLALLADLSPVSARSIRHKWLAKYLFSISTYLPGCFILARIVSKVGRSQARVAFWPSQVNYWRRHTPLGVGPVSGALWWFICQIHEFISSTDTECQLQGNCLSSRCVRIFRMTTFHS